MYKRHFGLAETPFSIAPDPRYLYMSKQHREALAHLIYGINRDGGFVLLTGEVGTGKTTVCRCFLEQIPENCDVAFIFNPKLTVEELLSTICDELRIEHPASNTSVKLLVDRINAFLLDAHAKGRRTVLIIDEAQNLSTDVLEQIRLLTNLETNRRKLLQIVLVAQPQLRDMLLRPELRQLAQRIVARYHLGRLSKQEVVAYVAHRLSVAGAHRQLFPASTTSQLFRLSGGVPRLINVLCDRALLGAYVQGKDRVDRPTLAKAAREAFGNTNAQNPWGTPRAVFAGLGLLGGAVAVAAAYYYYYEPLSVATVAQRVVEQRSVPRPTTESARPEAARGVIARPPLSLAQGNVAEPAAASLPPATLQWPADQPRNRSEALAFQALFKQWGLAAQPESGGNACRQAETLGLHCWSNRSGLDDLRRLNRPAVLQLRDEQSQNFFAALTALQGQTATLTIGTETRRVAVSALVSRWSGSYILLWQTPPNYRDVIRPGSRGPAVEWLSRQLALAQGRTTQGQKNPAFDDVLLRQVKEFQLAAGLAPDGVVGPQTLIHLDTALGGGSPKLTGLQKDG